MKTILSSCTFSIWAGKKGDFGVKATFDNIWVISSRSIILMDETGVHGENHPPVASHRQTLSHNVVSSTPRHECDSNSQL